MLTAILFPTTLSFIYVQLENLTYNPTYQDASVHLPTVCNVTPREGLERHEPLSASAQVTHS